MGRTNAVLAAVAVMLIAGPSSAPAQTAAERQALGSQIEQRFDVLPVQGLPHLADPVHPVVVLEQRHDPLIHRGVGDRPGRGRSCLGGVVGARGDLRAGLGEGGADRLDPELLLVLVDVRDQRVEGRSSSAAKKAEADVKISLARRSSATCFFRSRISAISCVVLPCRTPPSPSA